MKQKLALTLTGVLLISMAFSGIVASQATPSTPDGTNNTTTNASETRNISEAPPGLQIAVTVGATEKQVTETFERVALGHQLQTVSSQEARSKIINSFLEDETEQVENASSDELQNETENQSQTKYNEAMQVVNANAASQNADFAQQLAEKYNVSMNDSKVEVLRSHAQNMTGQEVSAVARMLGGGPPVFAGPPAHAGPGGQSDTTNSTKRGPPAHAGPKDKSDTQKITNETVANTIETANTTITNAENVSNETLSDANALLTDAEEEFNAVNNTSEEEVREELLEDAYESANEAIETVTEAEEQTDDKKATESEQ